MWSSCPGSSGQLTLSGEECWCGIYTGDTIQSTTTDNSCNYWISTVPALSSMAFSSSVTADGTVFADGTVTAEGAGALSCVKDTEYWIPHFFSRAVTGMHTQQKHLGPRDSLQTNKKRKTVLCLTLDLITDLQTHLSDSECHLWKIMEIRDHLIEICMAWSVRVRSQFPWTRQYQQSSVSVWDGQHHIALRAMWTPWNLCNCSVLHSWHNTTVS